MRSRHAAVVSLILALAVASGAYAAQRTTAASSDSNTPKKDVAPALVKRARALDRMEASLRKALGQRPPALPKVPHFKPVRWAPVPSFVAAPVPQPAAPQAAPQVKAAKVSRQTTAAKSRPKAVARKSAPKAADKKSAPSTPPADTGAAANGSAPAPQGNDTPAPAVAVHVDDAAAEHARDAAEHAADAARDAADHARDAAEHAAETAPAPAPAPAP